MKCSHPLKKQSILFCIFFVLAFSLPAYASEKRDDQWQFQLAPYAWLSGQSGTVSTFPNVPPIDIDVDFWDDVLGNINFAGFVVAEARKDRIGVFLDIAYADIEDDSATPGPNFSSASLRTKSLIASGAGLYRLTDSPKYFLDFLAGVRFWEVESIFSLKSGTAPGMKASNDEDWIDPFIGVKGKTPLGESDFFINGFLLIGGFGVGSDLMWDVNLNLGYNWTPGFSTLIGYRYFEVDYEDGGFLYDIGQGGPILGLSWMF